MGNITAHRDGQTRQFTPKQWHVMGIGKCGWSAVPEVPREVVQAIVQTIERAPDPTIVETKTAETPPIKTRKKRRK